MIEWDFQNFFDFRSNTPEKKLEKITTGPVATAYTAQNI
jgi:hypothetical protein